MAPCAWWMLSSALAVSASHQLDMCKNAECFQDDTDGAAHLALLATRSQMRFDDAYRSECYYGYCPNKGKPYELIALPYAFNALESWIDNETMYLHHDKHLQTYVTNINAAFQVANKTVPCLNALQHKAVKLGATFVNNGGGVWNHDFFFQELAPNANKTTLSKKLARAISKTFGNYTGFQAKFKAAALSRFGSGWAWLVVCHNSELCITTTKNQENPLMELHDPDVIQGIPILTVDIWEHAYYLKHQNRRAEYIDHWWNTVDLGKMSKRYECALNHLEPYVGQ